MPSSNRGDEKECNVLNGIVSPRSFFLHSFNVCLLGPLFEAGTVTRKTNKQQQIGSHSRYNAGSELSTMKCTNVRACGNANKMEKRETERKVHTDTVADTINTFSSRPTFLQFRKKFYWVRARWPACRAPSCSRIWFRTRQYILWAFSTSILFHFSFSYFFFWLFCFAWITSNHKCTHKTHTRHRTERGKVHGKRLHKRKIENTQSALEERKRKITFVLSPPLATRSSSSPFQRARE